MNKIEWKIVNNHPNYRVSSNGKIAKYVNGKWVRQTEHIRTGGHRYVLLSDNKSVAVYKIVAEHYLPPSPEPVRDYKLMHIDGDKGNNRVNNLKWLPYLRQKNDNERTRRIKHWNPWTPETAERVFAWRKAGWTVEDIATKTGANWAQVSYLIHDKYYPYNANGYL